LTGYGPEARRVAVYDEVRTIITARATKLKAIGAILSDLMELATDTVRSVLAEPGPVFQPYLRNLADAYILLAFLRQTPQVDKALGTLFGQGVLVLDTTVILPCFAETLLPPGQRIFTTTLRAAREAGLDVHITRGVLEEVDIHLNNSLNCYRMPPGQWTGQAPFVLRHWQQHAKGGSDFATFVRQFRGPNNPADDIADFLASVSGATLIDLAEPTQNADLATRGQITELWLERRRWLNRGQRDDKDLDILVRHDTEMFFGVLGLREVKKRGLRGHEAWWVTSDTTAFAMPFIAKREGIQLPSRPAMDPGFLSNMLALGPGASKIKPNLRKMLPAALDIQHFGWGIPLISETEAKIRAECEGQPEFVIRRKLRDAADQLRADQRQHERGFAIEDLLIQPE